MLLKCIKPLLLVTLFTHFFGAFGQTIDPDFADGRLYVKLTDNAHTLWPEYEGKDAEQLYARFPKMIELIRTHRIQLIRHPFKTPSAKLARTYEIRFEDFESSANLQRGLLTMNHIEYVERIPLVKKYFEPNDYSELLQPHLEVINAQGAWDLSQGNEEVIIAIVDDAVMTNHVDLAPNIWTNPGEIPDNGIDDDGNGYVDDVNGYNIAFGNNNPNPVNNNVNHGTLVAGTAAAATNNNIGVAGIGFNCKIMAVATGLSDGSISPNVYEGVDYAAVTGADILNLSWGGPFPSITEQNLITAIHDLGIIIVSSAGNTNADLAGYPSSYEHVISVAYTNNLDVKASDATYHETVDISAPGVSIRTTNVNSASGSYAVVDGSSFSSPLVAGVLGLMKSVNPCLTPDEAEFYLKQTAVNIDAQNPTFVGKLGAGRLDAAAAVASVMPTVAPLGTVELVRANSCSNKFRLEVQRDSNLFSCGNSFFWIVSGGDFNTTSELRAPEIEFPESGSYSITLIMNNALGSASTQRQVEVELITEYSLEAGEDVSLCLGETVEINAITDAPSGEISDAFWNPPIGFSNPAGLATQLAPLSSITYTLTLSLRNGCVLTDELKATVTPKPTTLILTPDTEIQSGQNVPLLAAGAASYSWSPSAGLSDSTIANPIASPESTTVYTVRGFSGENCFSEDSVTITVNTVSLDQNFEQEVGQVFPIYPNPAQTQVTFSADFVKQGGLRLELYSLQGQKLRTLSQQQVGIGTFSWDWSIPRELSSGNYLVLWRFEGTAKTQYLQIH